MKVFISHSSNDKQFAEDMIKHIGADLVTLDKYSFEPAQKLTDSIKNSIDSCEIFVLLISQDCLNSLWCQEEIKYVTPLTVTKGIKFLPFSIDSTIKAKDRRLDDWVWDLLVKNYEYPKLLARVIKRRVKDIIGQRNPLWNRRNMPLFGRTDDMRKLEDIYYSSNIALLRAMFVSGFPLVGRKSFMSKFLIDYLRSTDRYYTPLSIHLLETDSIEQFVLQLNDKVGKYTNEELLTLIADGKDITLNLAIGLIKSLFDYQERIIIDDDACIVNSGGRVSAWFIDIVESVQMPASLMILVASRYRPNPRFVSEHDAMIELPITTLNRQSMLNLFVNTAKIKEITINKDDREEIINLLTGYPKQIFDICDYIPNHLMPQVKHFAGKLRESYYRNYSIIVDQLTETATDLLILLSRFDFISVDLLDSIYDNYSYVEPLNELDQYSLYEVFGENNSYISLNSAISDYVTRKKMKLRSNTELRLKEVTNKLLGDLDGSIVDLSAQLYAIKEYIRTSPKDAKLKYILPTFVLKVIVEEYHSEHYQQVINISKRLINSYKHNNYQDCINSVHFWYCCALCRLQLRDDFEREVDYFNQNAFDFNYLQGFFFRLSTKKSHKERSLKYYNEALMYRDSESVSCSSVAKILHEQVVVMMQLKHYYDALDLAKQNYENNPHNSYHIHAYFDCLIKSRKSFKADTPEQLIKAMQETHDSGTNIYVQTMKAQLKYYVDNDFTASIASFRKIFKNPYNSYGMRYAHESLYEICLSKDALSIYIDITGEDAKHSI